MGTGECLYLIGGGRGIEGAGEGVDEEGRKSEGKLSMMCWNVCGWCKDGRQIDQMREELDIRVEVIDSYRPDIVTLVEPWLKGDEEVVVERYKWSGNNRKHLYRKQGEVLVELEC